MNSFRIPERLPGVFGDPIENLAIMEFVADLKTHHAAFGRQLFQQPVGHGAWNIVDLAQSMMSRNHRIGADIDGLRDSVIGGMRYVDHHAEAISLVNPGPPALIKTVIFECSGAA